MSYFAPEEIELIRQFKWRNRDVARLRENARKFQHIQDLMYSYAP